MTRVSVNGLGDWGEMEVCGINNINFCRETYMNRTNSIEAELPCRYHKKGGDVNMSLVENGT